MAKRILMGRLCKKPGTGNMAGEDLIEEVPTKRHRPDYTTSVWPEGMTDSYEGLQRPGVSRLFQTAFINWLKARENPSIISTEDMQMEVC